MPSATLITVHGVNHGKAERARYHTEWRDALSAMGWLFLDFHPTRWHSTDSFVLDGLTSPLQMEKRIADVVNGFEGAHGLLDLCRRVPRPVILAHSWGTVIAHLAKVMFPELSTVPMIGIGSPYTHATLGAALRVFQRAPKGNPSTHFICNRDDKICSVSRWAPTWKAPKGTRLSWVRYDGPREGLTQEHEPWQYFQTPTFTKALTECLS